MTRDGLETDEGLERSRTQTGRRAVIVTRGECSGDGHLIEHVAIVRVGVGRQDRVKRRMRRTRSTSVNRHRAGANCGDGVPDIRRVGRRATRNRLERSRHGRRRADVRAADVRRVDEDRERIRAKIIRRRGGRDVYGLAAQRREVAAAILCAPSARVNHETSRKNIRGSGHHGDARQTTRIGCGRRSKRPTCAGCDGEARRTIDRGRNGVGDGHSLRTGDRVAATIADEPLARGGLRARSAERRAGELHRDGHVAAATGVEGCGRIKRPCRSALNSLVRRAGCHRRIGVGHDHGLSASGGIAATIHDLPCAGGGQCASNDVGDGADHATSQIRSAAGVKRGRRSERPLRAAVQVEIARAGQHRGCRVGDGNDVRADGGVRAAINRLPCDREDFFARPDDVCRGGEN